MMDILEEARQFRRDLHRIPELGFQEHETCNYLWKILKETLPDSLDIFCGTGIRAVYRCNVPHSETVAFRADMDALPICEETGLTFASVHEGVMHACGHDGHMAALLLLARKISREREKLCRNVVLIFQPSEETRCGAAKMVAAGVLEKPDIDRIYACHLWPGIRKGYFATKAGVLMAQACYPDITIDGQAAHGANPDQGSDAVVAASGLIQALQTVISRNTPPERAVVITFGRIEGGAGRNIIPAHVRMEGTVRAFSAEDFDRTIKRMEEIILGIGTAYNVRIEMKTNDHYPCVDNDVSLAEGLRRLLGSRLELAEPVPNAEDFSYYQLKVPGVMLFAGIDDGVHETRLHSPRFNFDEAILPDMADLYWRIIQQDREELI